jgi:hypothetical protein
MGESSWESTDKSYNGSIRKIFIDTLESLEP